MCQKTVTHIGAWDIRRVFILVIQLRDRGLYTSAFSRQSDGQGQSLELRYGSGLTRMSPTPSHGSAGDQWDVPILDGRIAHPSGLAALSTYVVGQASSLGRRLGTKAAHTSSSVLWDCLDHQETRPVDALVFVHVHGRRRSIVTVWAIVQAGVTVHSSPSDIPRRLFSRRVYAKGESLRCA